MRQIITVSKQTGTGWEEVSGEVARALGYQYFDKQLINAEGPSASAAAKA